MFTLWYLALGSTFLILFLVHYIFGPLSFSNMARNKNTKLCGNSSKSTPRTGKSNVKDTNTKSGRGSSKTLNETDGKVNIKCQISVGSDTKSGKDELEFAIEIGEVEEPQNKNRSYHCNVCDKSLKTKQAIRNHLNTANHRNQLLKGPFKTLESGRSTPEEDHDQMSVSSEDENKMDIVEQSFVDGVLQRSKEVDKPFWCTVCLKSFKQESGLKTHLLSKKHSSKSGKASSVNAYQCVSSRIEDQKTQITERNIVVEPLAERQNIPDKKNIKGMKKSRAQKTQDVNITSSQPTCPSHATKQESKGCNGKHKNKSIIHKSSHLSNYPEINPQHEAAITCPIKVEIKSLQSSCDATRQLSTVKELTTISDESVQEPLQSGHLYMYSKDTSLVLFDIETGGFELGVDILQISAVCDNYSFNQYVTPTKIMDPKAHKRNKLTNQRGILMKVISEDPLRYKKLQTLPIKQTLQQFMAWLDNIGQCFLVGHNVAFDKAHFLYHLKQEGLLLNIKDKVLGFIDTLPLYRSLYPDLKKPAGPGHSQHVLVKHILGDEYEAYDAMEDVKALKRLVDETNVTRESLLHYLQQHEEF